MSHFQLKMPKINWFQLLDCEHLFCEKLKTK